MEIRRYNELPQDLKVKLKEANIFFQPNYVEYIHQNNEEMYYAYNDERVLPIRHRMKVIFNFGTFVSEPFLIVNTPIEAEDSYMEEVVKTASKKLHVQWLNSTAACLFSSTPKTKCKRIPFGSHIIDLTLTEEELWGNVHSKHRNVIRKAQKESVIIEKGGNELIEDYAILERQTQDRTGRKANGSRYYTKQVSALKENIVVYIAYRDRRPQAGGIFYYNQRRCYYMYGATAKDAFIGSANLLIWTAVQDMKAQGVKEFSFVGCRINEDEESKYRGIQMFKKRFGGGLCQGFMFRYENSQLMYKLFCKIMQWRIHSDKIYLDPIDEEIHKWKDIQVSE